MDIVSLPQPGGCLCRAVRYSLNAKPLLAYACHCHDCQTRSGAAFTLTLVVRSADVLVEGPLDMRHRRTHTGREVDTGYCPQCHVPIASQARTAPDIMTLRAGTLDDASWVRPVVQTWVESAIPWAVIPGVRRVAWADFDFTELGREWAETAPAFASS